MTPTDELFVVLQEILLIGLCFSWEMAKGSYRESKCVAECLCEDVYVVVISLSERENWL